MTISYVYDEHKKFPIKRMHIQGLIQWQYNRKKKHNQNILFKIPKYTKFTMSTSISGYGFKCDTKYRPWKSKTYVIRINNQNWVYSISDTNFVIYNNNNPKQ